ncbi:MAG: hypothetical protein NT155_03625 [Candidatus Staskawiczbacteria bacterium]|nr:hypothetical protein [Candidatus Staskawiczbacteria bacterium]
MGLTPRPEYAGKSKYIQTTKILVECSKCKHEYWIKQDDFDVSHMQNCHWCKELAEATRVISDNT